jgi:hypothetical protein
MIRIDFFIIVIFLNLIKVNSLFTTYIIVIADIITTVIDIRSNFLGILFNRIFMSRLK